MISGTPNLNNTARFVLAGLFGIFMTAATFGQAIPSGPPPGVGPPPNKNPNVADRSRQVGETELRGVELRNRTDEEREKRVQAAIANLKEDFARIQVLRNDIARSLVAHKPLDYELIRKQTTEINRRSNRMNLYLQAHAPAGEKETKASEPDREEMTSALVRLCKLIDSFTENPVLKNLAILDSKEMSKAKEERANADKDLLAIIKLSASLQKQAGDLRFDQ
jgi:hypothetical protein